MTLLAMPSTSQPSFFHHSCLAKPQLRVRLTLRLLPYTEPPEHLLYKQHKPYERVQARRASVPARVLHSRRQVFPGSHRSTFQPWPLLSGSCPTIVPVMLGKWPCFSFLKKIEVLKATVSFPPWPPLQFYRTLVMRTMGRRRTAVPLLTNYLPLRLLPSCQWWRRRCSLHPAVSDPSTIAQVSAPVCFLWT